MVSDWTDLIISFIVSCIRAYIFTVIVGGIYSFLTLAPGLAMNPFEWGDVLVGIFTLVTIVSTYELYG